MFSRRGFLLSSAGALVAPGLVLAQSGYNERDIAPQLTANDKEDVWTLHFRFQDPRIIVERVPGRGTKIVWYMIYRVYNLDPRNEPVKFVPDIELVTLDRHTRFPDEILPSVEETIKDKEDPTKRYKIKNSVTISAEDIPVSKKDAFPRAVSGVAIWTGIDDPLNGPDGKPLPRTNKFSIFIAGLSNGYTEEKPPDQPGIRIIKRKTLQLDFERLGDGALTEPSGIRWTGAASWIYRASTDPLKLAAAPGKKDPTVLATPRLEPIPAIPVRRVKE